MTFFSFSRSLMVSGLIFFACSDIEAREWKLQSGEKIEADFYFRDEKEAWFKDRNGKLYVIESTLLQPEDLEFIERLESYLVDEEKNAWPRQIVPRASTRTTGGPETYRSPHFQVFASSAREPMVKETVEILENAYAMIERLPLPIDAAPPRPLKHFTVRMLNRPQFEKEFGASVRNLYPEKVKGAYMAKQRELWLPLDASPAPDFTSTLVHEMAHQSMHDLLPLLPLWFIEGFAEYLAAIPYQNQIFRFDQSEAGLRDALESRYGSPPLLISHPARQLSTENWENSSTDYLSALFLVFFLAEYDRDGKGTGLRAYLEEIEAARQQTGVWFAEIQAMADAYNDRVRQFHQDMEAYRGEIESVKSELRSGKRVFVRESAPNRVVIAGTPAIPTRPVAPEQPGDLPGEISKNRDRVINLITSSKQAAVIRLLQGRSFEEFAEEMRNAFHSRGFAVEYR
ncbi:MAG: hypothetical protein AAF491_03605 [Verrucomicrobiota bacterium]